MHFHQAPNMSSGTFWICNNCKREFDSYARGILRHVNYSLCQHTGLGYQQVEQARPTRRAADVQKGGGVLIVQETGIMYCYLYCYILKSQHPCIHSYTSAYINIHWYMYSTKHQYNPIIQLYVSNNFTLYINVYLYTLNVYVFLQYQAPKKMMKRRLTMCKMSWRNPWNNLWRKSHCHQP